MISSQNKNWSILSFLVFCINSVYIDADTIDIKYFKPERQGPHLCPGTHSITGLRNPFTKKEELWFWWQNVLVYISRSECGAIASKWLFQCKDYDKEERLRRTKKTARKFSERSTARCDRGSASTTSKEKTDDNNLPFCVISSSCKLEEGRTFCLTKKITMILYGKNLPY